MKKRRKRLTKKERMQIEINKLEAELLRLNTFKEIQLYLRAIHTDFDSTKHTIRCVKFYVERLAATLKISLEPTTAEFMQILDPNIMEPGPPAGFK